MESKPEYPSSCSSEGHENESDVLLNEVDETRVRKRRGLLPSLMFFSYATNAILSVTVAILATRQYRTTSDPSMQLYSPAQNAVEYIPQLRFRAALFNKTEYMGFPDDETDQLWSDLYNYGISKINAEEAKLLAVPTLPIPGTDDFLVELDIFHELHCLNDIRKLLYPERFHFMEDITLPNGTVDRDNDAFRHWDHCIDSIRQALMCHADVSPISFHINVPASTGIFPRLETVHTCRDFDKIRDWSLEHWAGDWDFHVTPEKAEEIIANAPDDQGPWEDIQFLYELFPGNKYFDYWKTHSVDT